MQRDPGLATSFRLLLAQGFGLGRIPFAPGTFGSMAGMVWLGLLLMFSSWAVFLIGTVIGIGISVVIGTEAERLLARKDPSSVVLDEIAAVPVCFIAVLAQRFGEGGYLPRPSFLWSGEGLIWAIAIFCGFRFFDIVKPWPVRLSQNLPGGWGVTVDDVVAAGYVNVCVLVYAWWV